MWLIMHKKRPAHTSLRHTNSTVRGVYSHLITERKVILQLGLKLNILPSPQTAGHRPAECKLRWRAIWVTNDCVWDIDSGFNRLWPADLNFSPTSETLWINMFSLGAAFTQETSVCERHKETEANSPFCSLILRVLATWLMLAARLLCKAKVRIQIRGRTLVLILR